MEPAQTSLGRYPLRTDTMTEMQFRIAADLCRTCGVARSTNPNEHTCDQCWRKLMHREIAYLRRKWKIAA